MNPVAQPNPWPAAALLSGDAGQVSALSERWDLRSVAHWVGLILLGAGCYGAAMGWWRAPQQALFTAVKFPLIMLLVSAGNSVLNAMLAPLLGLNIPFRQSFLAILMSFAAASVILGALSPLAAFLVWNAPPLEAAQSSGTTYSLIMVVHVVAIAFAGITANLRLWTLLRERARNTAAANRVLVAWLAGNLFLGSQLTWICRPFIGSPGLPLQFLRDDPLNGNFYEALFRSLGQLLGIH